MLVDVTSMTASVGRSIFGSGTESTRTSRLPCHVTAFMERAHTRLPPVETAAPTAAPGADRGLLERQPPVAQPALFGVQVGDAHHVVLPGRGQARPLGGAVLDGAQDDRVAMRGNHTADRRALPGQGDPPRGPPHKALLLNNFH